MPAIYLKYSGYQSMISFLSLFKLDLNRAMRPIELVFLKCDNSERRKRLLALIYSTVFLSISIDRRHRSNSAEFFFIKSLKRADYDLLFNSIIDQCPHPKASFDIIQEQRAFSVTQIMRLILLLPLLIKIRKTDITHWLFMYLSLVKIYSTMKYIPANKDVHIVVFADMQPLDNLLVQHANRQQQVTSTLQHGLYVDYGSADESNVNIVNYLNAEAKNFLAWGGNTADLIKKYHPGIKTFICGKPTLSKRGDVEIRDYFTIIFDQNLFFRHNLDLLDIAYKVSEDLDLKVNIRLHPNNRVDWVNIDPAKVLVNEDVECSKFVIGHTSSLIYECMRIGLPAFRYNTSAPALDTSDSILFSNAQELLALLDDVTVMPDLLAAKYIQSIGAHSMENYRSYFNGELAPSG